MTQPTAPLTLSSSMVTVLDALLIDTPSLVGRARNTGNDENVSYDENVLASLREIGMPLGTDVVNDLRRSVEMAYNSAVQYRPPQFPHMTVDEVAVVRLYTTACTRQHDFALLLNMVSGIAIILLR